MNKKSFLKLFSFLLIILFSIYSCSRVDYNTKPELTAKSLANSQNFQTLSKLLITNLNTKKDFNKLSTLTAKKVLTSSEREEYYSNLGFSNENEYLNFQKNVIEINKALANEFDFSNLSDSQKITLVNEALEMNSGPEADPNLYDGPIDQGGDGYAGICSEQYSACKQSAYGTYIITVTGCIAGGIGIAAGSAGWAAPVGGALAGACVAGAQIQYDGAVKQCYYSYLQCKKNE